MYYTANGMKMNMTKTGKDCSAKMVKRGVLCDFSDCTGKKSALLCVVRDKFPDEPICNLYLAYSGVNRNRILQVTSLEKTLPEFRYSY